MCVVPSHSGQFRLWKGTYNITQTNENTFIQYYTIFEAFQICSQRVGIWCGAPPSFGPSRALLQIWRRLFVSSKWGVRGGIQKESIGEKNWGKKHSGREGCLGEKPFWLTDSKKWSRIYSPIIFLTNCSSAKCKQRQ